MAKQWTPPSSDTPVDTKSTWTPPSTDVEVEKKNGLRDSNTGLSSLPNGGVTDLNSLTNTSHNSYTPAVITDPHLKAINTFRGQQSSLPASKPINKDKSVIDNVSEALYLPAFNKGFNDLVVKPAAGATDFIDRTIDKLYTGITGDQTPDWLRKKGAFDKVASYYDQAYQNREKPSNIVSETAEGVVGTLPLMASMFTGGGEASMAAKAPNLISGLTKTLATTKGLSAYKDATDQGKGYVESLNEAGKGAISGAKEGLTMEAQMMLGGALGKGVANKLAEKGLLAGGKVAEKVLHALAVGTVFGGTSAGEDLLNGKDIDTHEALKQFGTGLAFEIIPTAKAIGDEVKSYRDNKTTNEQVLQNASVANASSNLHSESVLRTLINTPKDDLVNIKDNIPEGHDDLYASSLEVGVRALDTKNPSEKKAFLADQLALKTQGDVKYVSDKLSNPETANDVIDQIKSNDEISDEQKLDLIEKVQALSPKEAINEEQAPIAEANQPVPETAQVPDQTEQMANQENDIAQPETPIINEPSTPNPETPADVQGQSEQQAEATDNSEKTIETRAEQIETEQPDISHEDAVRQSIEQETNPKKIAAMYHTEASYPDYIEKGIIDYLGNGKINEKDYERLTGEKAKSGIDRWIDSKNSDKTDINTHAEILSHELGVQVTPQDIVETIDRYKGRKNFMEANKTEAQRLLEYRYKELTGKTLTARRAEKAYGSLPVELTPEQVDAFNKSAKEIGITQEDVDNYERAIRKTERAIERGNAKPAKDKVQQSKNEQSGRQKESGGDKSVESNAAKAGDPIRAFADRVRQGKINKLGGFKASTGFDAVWDGSLEVVAKTLEGTAKLADAIEAGLKHVKDSDWYKNLSNKEEFDQQYREHMQNEYAEHEKTLPLTNEKTSERAEKLGIDISEDEKTVRGQKLLEKEASDLIEKGYDTHGLIESILENKHEASDVEITILNKYIDATEAKINEYNERLAKDGATMSKRDFVSLMADKTEAEINFQGAAFASRKTKRASARALNASKFRFNKEASLENMIAQKRQANGDAKLTPEQLAEVTKTFSELDKARKDLEARLKKVEDENAKLKASQVVRKTVLERSARRGATKADLATERTKIFEDIRKEFADIRKSGQAMSDIPYRREFAAIAKHMPQLLRNLAQDGLVRIEDVVDNLYNSFKEDLPEITKRDITDLIAGNYNEPKPTKQGLQDDIRSLKQQAKLVNQIEDLESGIAKNEKAKKPVKKQTEQVEELRNRLKELINRQREANKEPEQSKEEKDLAALKKRIQGNIDKLSERLDKGDFDKEPPKEPVKRDTEAVELQRKYDRIKKDFDLGVAKDALANRSRTEKLKDDFLNVASLPRALKASLDFSAVLRQGLFLAPHLKESGTALKEMFGQTFSQEKYNNWLSDLKHSEMYDLMKDSDLYISDRSSPDIIAREEEFTSNLADKVPFIGGDIKINSKTIPGLIQSSERAYTAYLNVLRAGVFTSEAQKLIERGYTFENNPKEFKSLAKVVNVLSGRGDIPEFLGGKQPKILSNALFSPRFMASRIQTLYLWADPRLSRNARELAAKDIGAVLGSGVAILSLAALAGYQVNFNPTSTNFLRIRDKEEHGDTYYDIVGGLPQYVRLLSQLSSGYRQSVNGKVTDLDAPRGKKNPFGQTRADVLLSFMRGKLSPIPGMAWNLLSKKDVIGQPYHLWPNVPEELLPLPFTDVQDAYKVGGIDNALRVLAPSQFGVSVSSYDPNAKKKK